MLQWIWLRALKELIRQNHLSWNICLVFYPQKAILKFCVLRYDPNCRFSTINYDTIYRRKVSKIFDFHPDTDAVPEKGNTFALIYHFCREINGGDVLISISWLINANTKDTYPIN